MIDVNLYRFRVGTYNSRRHSFSSKSKTGKSGNRVYNFIDEYNLPANLKLIYLFYVLFIIYCGVFCTLFMMDCKAVRHDYVYIASPSIRLSNAATIHLRLAFFAIIAFLLNNFVRGLSPLCKFKKLSAANVFFGNQTSCLRQLIAILILFILALTFLMIAIMNTSLLNPGPQPGLSVYYQNVQGLIPPFQVGNAHPPLIRTKILEINMHIKNERPDIILLNETWLKKSINDKEVIEDPTYKIFRKDRTILSHPINRNKPKKFRENGGGVLIAIRDDFEATSKRISLENGAEILAIEVDIDNSKFIFCTCYRVGTLGIENHISISNSIKSFFSSKKPKKIFIVGDFNLSSLSWPFDSDNHISNSTERLFSDTFNELGLNQCINQPTHIKGKTLDILLTNHVQLLNNVCVQEHNSICKSDHFPVTFNVKTKIKRKKPTKRKCYNFKRADWDSLNQDLGNVNWDAILDSANLETAWSSFKTNLFQCVNKHIHTITIKSEFQPPWFDSELFQACNTKEEARRKFKRTKSKLDEIKFCNLRRNFNSLSNKKMRENLYNSDDPALITKKFWSHVKHVNNSHRIPESMYLNGRYRNNSIDKANLFNKFFCDQFSDRSEYNIDIDYSSDCLYNIQFSPSKIRDLLKKINSNKAMGPDGIHGNILKNCAVSLAYPLSILFYLSYNYGSIPREWKLANVVPIHKKGAKENIENYRPISLTCLIMKTFERIVKDKILVITSNKLDNRQHGFLSKKSCTTNMVGFCDSLALSLNDCIRTDVIYFDFSKAFDSVNHDILIQKLKHMYNIDGRLLKFIINYLKDREQQVIIGNCKSDRKSVLSGVPQGSILGPILFVLFINDLPLGLTPGTELALYADDTKIWRRVVTESDHDALQADINYLYNWSIENKMNFHPQKCKVVSVAIRPPPLLDILPDIQYFYTLGRDLLDYVVSEKDLGVDINSRFNFSEHCDRILSKANQQFGLTKRTCYFVNDIRRKRALYLTLIRSQFEHCSPIWRPTSDTLISKFENFQKKCLKWILSEECLHYGIKEIYTRKCRQLKLLPLSKRFDFNDLILFYKIVFNIIPVELPSYLHFFDGHSRLRSCHLDELCLVSDLVHKGNIPERSQLYKSFFYRTHLLWNNIPLEIRQISRLVIFRTELLKFLWRSIFTEGDSSNDIPIHSVLDVDSWPE